MTTVYTNGKSLFTLENYDKAAGVCLAHNINIHSEINKFEARHLHSNGLLFYVYGSGDRKELNNLQMSKKIKLNNFKIF